MPSIVPSRTALAAATLAAAGVLALVGAPAGVAAPTTPAVAPPGGSIIPIAPVRILDSRSSSPGGLTEGSLFPSAALPGVAAEDIAAVLVNVTVVNARAAGWIRVGEGAGTSNGNFVVGAPSATLALVPVSHSSGFASLVPFTASARVDVVADVEGYVTTPEAATTSTFTAVTPTRIADSRTHTGLVTFAPNGTQLLDVRKSAGLPANATAVVADLVAVKPTSATYLTAYPSGIGRPTASTLNASAGRTVANRVVLPLRADGRVAIYNHAGRTDVLVDVSGYVSPASTGSYYTPASATRIGTDTGEGLTLAPPAHGPGTTTAVWVSLASASDFDGYLVAGPTITLPAKTSDLNTIKGRAVANSGPVAIARDGHFRIASIPTSRYVVDFNGWFQTAAA